MDKPEKIKEEILNRELKKNIERKTMLQLQLSLNKKLDPNEVSGRLPLRRREDGTVLSWKDAKRSELIEVWENELEQVDLVIKTIEEQI